MNRIKTKIVCTIGPSSWDQDVMRQMIESGMSCARVNGAFADEAELDKVTDLVRNVSSEVSLMMDVKGPEVRLNKFSVPKLIKPGEILEIGNDSASEIYPANYKNLYTFLKVGQRIVIGDGDVELLIEDIKGDKMMCSVVFGDVLKPGKALNLPGAAIASSALTEKDIINLKHSIDLGWDFVSASFIQNKESALEVKKQLVGSSMQLIAKIEDQEGVDNIDEILEVVDGIMVARGGLGVELGLEKVPLVQRYLIERANHIGKPVITATQMLESMIYNPRPTRAETNDISTAIMQGTDAIMLSGESSAGKYPVEAVKWMAKTAEAVETAIRVRRFENVEEVIKYNPKHDNIMGRSAVAITTAAVEACLDLDVKAILVVTKGGFTARVLSRHKVNQPIFAYVADKSIARLLSLSGGIYPGVISELANDRDQVIRQIIKSAKGGNVIQSGDLVAIVVGSQNFSDVDSSFLELQVVR